ncbi:HAD family hydrolase [Desertihabitans aurantiacus]|uniref:HAD family hydrolase n=1 Tax=Desertihabitans aurantiacus TaxID=2282477 RepID=UPI000DF80A45|nr:HAD family hydrolase [Desertihabitans aurantiacus]
MIDTVLLDLDDTLLDTRSATRAAVLAWAADLGIDGDPDEIATRWSRIAEPFYARYQRRELTFPEQRRARVRAFVPSLDLTEDAAADELFAGYLRHYEDGWRLFDDAVPTLRRLRAAGLRTGVLTNGEEEQQTRKVERLGLAPLLDVVIASSALPFGKPHPLAFSGAVQRLGTRAEQVLMVGDSLEKDVRGALAAGLRAVLLDRYDVHGEVDVDRIRGLGELTVPG